MSKYEDDGDPNVGRLRETPEEFERRRIRIAAREADRLNQAQADIPMREDFTDPNKSFDTPEMTHDAIARMAAARGKSVRLHGAPVSRDVEVDHIQANRFGTPVRHEPPRSVLQIFDDNAKQEMQIMVQAVVGELSRGLMQTFDGLKKDIEENTRLLAVMNAPMEAITDSHERAASSFETLRADLVGLAGAAAPASTAAIERLTDSLDTAGLTEAQSRAEARFEQLTSRIEKQMEIIVDSQSRAFKALTADMVAVLHLLERLQSRELRETKNRMQKAASRAVGKHRK